MRPGALIEEWPKWGQVTTLRVRIAASIAGHPASMLRGEAVNLGRVGGKPGSSTPLAIVACWPRSRAPTEAHYASHMIGSKLLRVLRQPRQLPAAVLRRLVPSHPTLGYPWVHLPDGSITFRESGFVSAVSPASLLARHNYETAYIRRFLADFKADRSLEVGCGYGRLTPTFADFSNDHLAVDINEDALSLARATYPHHNFRCANSTELPFGDDGFDLVTTWTVVQHIPPEQVEFACAELLRVLAPGGTLLICEETRHANRSSGRAPHTWHRHVEDYERLFQPLSLQFSSEIEEIDRLPGMESPGRVMLWR